MRRRGIAIMCGLLVSILGGCSVAPGPKIAVTSATMRERTHEAAVADISLTMSNAGLEPLQLRWFDYRVTVDGVAVYRGRRAAEATLASRSTQSIDLPFVIRFDDLPGVRQPAAGRKVRVEGVLEYVAPGRLAEALLDSGVRVPRESFAGRAELADSE